jgi:hypothetical protein
VIFASVPVVVVNRMKINATIAELQAQRVYGLTSYKKEKTV